MIMVGQARKMRKMGCVIPTPQRPVSELLLGITDVTCNGSQSDLEGPPRSQLTADLQEKIVLVDGIAIDHLK
jgi:hypothetical protein